MGAFIALHLTVGYICSTLAPNFKFSINFNRVLHIYLVSKRFIMDEQDKVLLETYMWGFNDELDGRRRMWNPNPLLLRAYNLGRDDAIIGDDVQSSDLQTNDEILNRIRSRPNVC